MKSAPVPWRVKVRYFPLIWSSVSAMSLSGPIFFARREEEKRHKKTVSCEIHLASTPGCMIRGAVSCPLENVPSRSPSAPHNSLWRNTHLTCVRWRGCNYTSWLIKRWHCHVQGDMSDSEIVHDWWSIMYSDWTHNTISRVWDRLL